MPEVFEGAIRRAVVIGNGFAGAENQCIGLVRALGLANHHSYMYVFTSLPSLSSSSSFLLLLQDFHKEFVVLVIEVNEKDETLGLCSVLRFQTSQV